ncbi:MAG: VPLPA-CTERM sorting domain-containing protein [Pseudomonadota bacterium]
MSVRILLISCVTSVLASSSFAATILGTAADPAGLASTVEIFRNGIGPLNGNNPVNEDPNGRRQIDWDAAPDAVSDPNAFPGDFFNFSASPRARGIEFIPTGSTTGFQLSSTAASGEPVAFGFPDDFNPFSEERMFTPIDGNTFDVQFFDPVDQVTPAASRGLGIVFNDVEVEGSTTFEIFDAEGNLIDSQNVPITGNGGLSFVGFVFDDPIIASASITAGNVSGPDFDGEDRVVMDDFIFGEPIPINVAPIPLPASALLLGGAILGLSALRRRRA